MSKTIKPLLKTIKQVYKHYKDYSLVLLNLKLRRPNFPEYVSEGLIQHILNKTIDLTSRKYKNGDLISDKEGIQECKCFTSPAPISFGPNQRFDILYVLDGKRWTHDKFTLYRVNMSSEEFKNQIKISKNQTYGDQCIQKRRPKISWKYLYPQISNNCSIIFKGSIDEISEL
jgi:hypothetical protein